VVDYGYIADQIMYDGKLLNHETDYPKWENNAYSGCYLYDEEYEDEE
jgi:hypothetical protein